MLENVLDWGDGLTGKALVMEARRSEFRSQTRTSWESCVQPPAWGMQRQAALWSLLPWQPDQVKEFPIPWIALSLKVRWRVRELPDLDVWPPHACPRSVYPPTGTCRHNHEHIHTVARQFLWAVSSSYFLFYSSQPIRARRCSVKIVAEAEVLLTKSAWENTLGDLDSREGVFIAF